MSKITLKNQFHGTKVTLNAKETDNGYLISKSQGVRAKRELCGIHTCTCGDELAQRNHGNYGYFIVPQSSGDFLLITQKEF